MSDNTVEVNELAAGVNALSEEIGTWAEGKGFRDDWLLADKLEALANESPEIDIEEAEEILRAAAKALRLNVIGTKLMLVVSEIAEALETTRDNGVGVLDGEGNFGEELADGVIRLADLAHLVKSPIGDEVVRKVSKNVDRPHMHGRKL